MTAHFESQTVPALLRQIILDWGISNEQMATLCRVTPEVFQEWMTRDLTHEGTVPTGMDHAVPVIAVYKRLLSRNETEKWLFTPHPEFGNEKPIDVMASSLENLYWVSYFLDSSRAPD